MVIMKTGYLNIIWDSIFTMVKQKNAQNKDGLEFEYSLYAHFARAVK